MNQKERRQYFALSLALFAGILCVLIPLIATFIAAFNNDAALRGGIGIEQWQGMSVSNFRRNVAVLSENKIFVPALIRSATLSCLVSLVVAWASAALSFAVSRTDLRRLSVFTLLAYAAYLTPPVILVVAINLAQDLLPKLPAFLVIFLGHCVFLFPLSYGLALGHWRQTDFEIDRVAAVEGAHFFKCFSMHCTVGGSTFSFIAGIFMLNFMLSWSDVLFSRFLLIGSPEQRLLTDLVIDALDSSEILPSRGSLSVLSLLTVSLAIAASTAYALVFNHANVRR